MTPDQLLLAFHAAWPGVTAAALARGRTADGRSSYDLLIDCVRPSQRIVDLGCGDGYLLERLVARGHHPDDLVGIDMSAEELDAARRREVLSAVSLYCGRAEHLPLADSCCDALVSHLAYMLMSNIEAVTSEIGRVLVGGGLFATVVGGGPAEDEAFDLFLQIAQPIVARYHHLDGRMGDVRARHGDGLAELAAPCGFGPVVETCHDLRLDGTIDEVWATLSPMYEMHMVPLDAREQLRVRFCEQARALLRPDGTVPCQMRLRLLCTTRT